MRTTTIFVFAVLSFLTGCQPTYPGGLSQQEWEALPPDKRAQLQIQQDSVDQQRRANDNQEQFQNQVTQQNQDQPPVPPPAIADGPDMVRSWAVLGRQQIDFTTDHQIIQVGAGAGTFSTLRFTVHGGDIDVYKFIVVLGNGDKLAFDVRGHYGDNSISGALSIPKTPRYIDHIEVSYRSHAPRPFRTVLAVHGK